MIDDRLTVPNHFSIIDKMAKRLRTAPYGVGREPTAPLLDRLPGLLPLLNSLAAPSWTHRETDQRLLEEWNPLSQRVLLPDECAPEMSAFEQDFNLLRAHTQTFVEWAHEAAHVLALEPIFVGTAGLGSAEEVKRLYIAGEAFAFWYADMVVTRTIRRTIPNAELVYGRSAVSNLTFHPEEVFSRLGIRGARPILNSYLAAFLDDAGPITLTGDPFSKHMRQKIREFYDANRKPVEHLHGVYEDFSIGKFLERFCQMDGLPSLFTSAQLRRIGKLGVEAYVLELGTAMLPALLKRSCEDIERVCLRRHLQTRAYYAWFLQKLIGRGWVGAHQEGDPALVKPALDAYLDSLEAQLRQLSRFVASAQIERALREADQAFEDSVRAPLLDLRAYVTRRAFLHPFFAPTQGVVGLASESLPLTRGQMVAIVKLMTDKLDWGPAFTIEGDHETMAVLYSFLTVAKRCELDVVREEYNRFMTRPDVLPFWSVYLAAMQPGTNTYRELAFAFA